MIERPAERASLTFDKGLVDKILEDAGRDMGALALMAYALDELYFIAFPRGDRRITFVDYETLGGVGNAIGKRAEAVFEHLHHILGNETEIILNKVFQELISVNEEGTATKRRCDLAKLNKDEKVWKLIEAFIDARLFVSDIVSGKSTIEVAHEALFQSWSYLEQWLQTYKGDLWILGQVKRSAYEWHDNDRKDYYLWRHERLLRVYQAQVRLKTDLDQITEDFIKPEVERLIQVYYRGNTADYQKLGIIHRMTEIGETSLPYLLEILAKETSITSI
jgi:hypothetical protein